MSHVSLDFAHSCTFGAGLMFFAGMAPRRALGKRRRRSVLVRPFIARANSSIRRQQLLVRQRLERPRLVSVRRRVEQRSWWGRPVPSNLWRPGDPAPSSPRSGRCASPGVKPRLSQRAASGALAQPAFIPSHGLHAGAATVSRGFAGGGFTAALAAAIFISFTAPEFPTSARQSRPAMLSAAGFMGLAGQRESTSGGLSHQVLPAAVSMPAAHWERPTSARPPHQVLPAAGVMALEGAELSRAAARGSDKAA